MDLDEIFDNIAEELAPHGVTTGMMFGKRALKANGKAFVCAKGDRFAVRLGAGTPGHESALALPMAELFEPCEGKVFKDWVVIPSSHADQWPQLAELARQRITT